MKKFVYVLITPARNEDLYIEQTICSVINQTVLPERWIIVSDGSTDNTDGIVQQYQSRYSFIELLRRQSREERNFASKVRAFNDGIEKLKEVVFDFIGNLDADISFGPLYFERLLEEFVRNPRLGIAGGEIIDVYQNREYHHHASKTSIGGAVQFFRRKCFEEIGGFVPLEYGQNDAVVEITARMRGWETRHFPALKVLHYRRVGTEGAGILKARYRQGKAEYLIGYHPLFHFARTIQRLKQKPYILGSMIRTIGYLWACFKKPKRDISEEFVRFVRQEEMQKLRSLFR